MLKKVFLLFAAVILLLLLSTAVFADEGFYPWRNHAEPFGYLFGNLIDNHQQSKLVGRAMLQGYIYIQFTGEERDGVPVAMRADCTDPTLDCSLGWKFKAIPIRATLVSTGPRVWLVDEEDLPSSPQHVHFHWNGRPKKPCGLEIGETYDGYLMQRTAVTTFFWLGGNPDKGPGGNPDGPGGPGGSGDHDEGGCSGHDGTDETHDDGGCSGHDGTDETHDDGGCSGHDGTDETHDEGGCSGHDGTDETHDDGGCSGHDGGTGAPGDMGGPGDHGGHLITPGMDYHTNIVTVWDGSSENGHGGPGGPGGPGDAGGHDEDGCDGHDGTGDTHDDGGCPGHKTTAAGAFVIRETAVISSERIAKVAAYRNNN